MNASTPQPSSSTSGGVLSVVLAGGGTAGHVSPMLALADALRRQDPRTGIVCLGTAEGLESRLVPERGYELRAVPKVPLPRRPTPALLSVPSRLLDAVRTADRVLGQTHADVVVGMGGYVSTPAYLAARRRGIPIVVHEQNARPGIANRLGARLTRHVAVTFPGTPLPHAVRVGMPLRREISTLDASALRSSAREHFGLDPDAPVLLVTGGSLGAQKINETMAAAADRLQASGIGVLHLTGAGKAIQAPTGPGPAYVVAEYTDRMDLAYAAADLVLCRAGANTVCEVTTVGLPGVYVPLPIGNGEQRLNAEPVVADGGGLLIDNADLDPAVVTGQIADLLTSPSRLASMAQASARHGSRDADIRLADLVRTAAGHLPAGEPGGPGPVTP
ncbi:MAG: undecaprenyldiphospho-muramoylpentapeptide beta-N-acetylglucosaminyltransferase [Actinomycetales bacterium]